MTDTEDLTLVERYRGQIVGWLNSDRPAALQIPKISDGVISSIVLYRRKFAQLAPWALREYRYVAPVAVLSSDPDRPLVFGEWRIWYRYPDFVYSARIPPHVNDLPITSWVGNR